MEKVVRSSVLAPRRCFSVATTKPTSPVTGATQRASTTGSVHPSATRRGTRLIPDLRRESSRSSSRRLGSCRDSWPRTPGGPPEESDRCVAGEGGRRQRPGNWESGCVEAGNQRRRADDRPPEVGRDPWLATAEAFRHPTEFRSTHVSLSEERTGGVVSVGGPYTALPPRRTATVAQRIPTVVPSRYLNPRLTRSMWLPSTMLSTYQQPGTRRRRTLAARRCQIAARRLRCSLPPATVPR